MFLRLEQRNSEDVLAVDSTGSSLTCGELFREAEQLRSLMRERSLVFLLCENTTGALAAYLACILTGAVPVMLGVGVNAELLDTLLSVYQPGYVFRPFEKAVRLPYTRIYDAHGYVLLDTGFPPCPMRPSLELLMTTSGSTGSPKMVRYKTGNLDANAKNVALAFGWTPEERPLCDLAMNYTMGLNVVNTHLYAGATVYLSRENIMNVAYWDFLRAHRLTNLTGVPFSYELMLRLGLADMNLPYLRTFAQGGGKLPDRFFRAMAEYAARSGKRFVATFGTTETAARMTMLNPSLALEKVGSIGQAIPEGRLWLEDEHGSEISTVGTEGELVYAGPNVTMGYAVCREDLFKDDEFRNVYHTGDLAKRDETGDYFITGRKSRFVKLLGYRVSLDECERLVEEKFGLECACTGRDDAMELWIVSAPQSAATEDAVLSYVSKTTGFYRRLFQVRRIETIPKSDSGKKLYSQLSAEPAQEVRHAH